MVWRLAPARGGGENRPRSGDRGAPRAGLRDRLRRGVAAGIVATIATELIAGLTGGPTTIFVTPLAAVLGHLTTLAGLCFRAAVLGLLFAALERHLPGRGAARKGVAFAGFVWLLSLIARSAAGDMQPGIDDAARLLLALVHGAILGAAYHLLTPEGWQQDTVTGHASHPPTR